jgi:pimeloyl-ACP methyl ester carboxylesterase
MPTIELSTGTVAYEDTGGPGPVLVLLHGLVQDGTLWREVVADLRADHRCVVPTLPEGSHRHPVRADAELTPRSVARLVAEFLERLGLTGVTLVENDSGRAQQVAAEHPERLARLVLVACEALENYPPGLPGKLLVAGAKVPGGITALTRVLGARPLRRLPVGLGALTRRPLPDDLADGWLHALRTYPAIRADLGRYLRGSRKGEMLEAAEGLRRFDRPALVVWAADDLLMPGGHGPRLAAILPRGRFVEIADSRTLVPVDQPERLAAEIRAFVRDTPTGEPGADADVS